MSQISNFGQSQTNKKKSNASSHSSHVQSLPLSHKKTHHQNHNHNNNEFYSNPLTPTSECKSKQNESTIHRNESSNSLSSASSSLSTFHSSQTIEIFENVHLNCNEAHLSNNSYLHDVHTYYDKKDDNQSQLTKSQSPSIASHTDLVHQDRKFGIRSHSNSQTVPSSYLCPTSPNAHNSKVSTSHFAENENIPKNCLLNGNDDEYGDVDEEENNERDTESYHSLNNDEEKKQNSNYFDFLSSPTFMDNAISIYGKLDDALNSMNRLRSKQVHKQRTLRQRRMKRQKNPKKNEDFRLSNDKSRPSEDDDNDDINHRVIEAMKFLVDTTSQMGSLFSHKSESSSLIGSAARKLSSAFAYMSYVSVSAITPYLYSMLEAVLLELYATIKDIIEYYDPEPKNNVLYRIIQKMNDIIEAIQGLLALSDCFYEIDSENDNDETKTADDDTQQNDICEYEKKKTD